MLCNSYADGSVPNIIITAVSYHMRFDV